MSSVKNVLIVGGGIGGLSAGIALQQAGIQAEIIEYQPEYKVYGVGIIQPSNALRALDQIGVADQCLEEGYAFNTFHMCASNGHRFTTASTLPLGRFPGNNGIPRNRLHHILLEAARLKGIHIRMGTTVTHIDNQSDAAHVTFSDNTSGSYDLVIGADGLHSKVRSLIFGDQIKSQYTGQSVWRFTTERPAEVDNGFMIFGKKSKAGLVPMTKNSMYLLCVTAEGDRPKISEDQMVSKLKEHLSEYTTPLVTDIINRIQDPKDIVYRPLEWLLLPDPWYQNRVVIIGDAAHATLPQLGQGASLAIEDAVVLAEELQKEGAVSEVLSAFMERRFDRCKMIVNVSKTIGEWEQMEWKGTPVPDANIGALMGRTLANMMAPI
ncbi:FAD-dependent oxidoreductase [Rhodocytophaga rosea]|uniref:FAD-dependent oxidoreductase n=1 Tax=Rhodocytophaga rosea TaxID=2704465 RepID=A0A6C0GCA8_9BACT|nr:FAD-dependent oxidoreductase [Rhodocytophaga rosea]QHT65462.1 FAD-dependent oxidoreductase [Rhodocytophaga rosea]